MFNAPSFNLSDLWWASVDLLTGNWFYLALFVATCGYIATMLLYNLWRWLKSRAEKKAALLEAAADFEAFKRQIADEQKRMSAVVSISDRRGKGAA